jgi:heme a synthase
MLLHHSASKTAYQPGPHSMAWALVGTVFPLIWVGGLVTTHDAGMAVPDWPGTYGYNMFLYPWTSWLAAPWDLFIEHGHRLLGSLAGILTIGFVACAFRYNVPPLLRWLAPTLLLLVVFQGVLGGLRVRMKSESLALVHGCVGPLFFACCTAAVVLTSRRWHEANPLPNSAAITRSALAGLILAYVQLIFGAVLRHPADDGSPRLFHVVLLFHIMLAVALLGHIVAMAWKIHRQAIAEPWLKRPASLLLVLAFTQITLGFSTLIVKYGWPTWLGGNALPFAFTVQAKSFWSSLIITGHVAVGSLILATMTTLWLRSVRVCGWGFQRMRNSATQTWGVAL